MRNLVHNYLRALEAGDANKAASQFIADGWVQSPFLGRMPVRPPGEYWSSERIFFCAVRRLSWKSSMF